MFKEQIRKEQILCIDGGEKDEVLRQLCGILWQSGKVSSREELESKIFYREGLMSTGLGLGLGVPHVRADCVEGLNIAIAVSKSPIKGYECLDGSPVRLVVMIAASERSHKEHILLLSEIVQALKDQNLRDALLASRDSAAVFDLIRKGV